MSALHKEGFSRVINLSLIIPKSEKNCFSKFLCCVKKSLPFSYNFSAFSKSPKNKYFLTTDYNWTVFFNMPSCQKEFIKLFCVLSISR